MLTIILIAFGLAMDAFAVSIASGATIKELKIKHAFRIALFFGGFQALMPLIGWLAGGTVSEFVKSVDHWICFGILSFIGAKMIYESGRMREGSKTDCTKLSVLLVLAFATSVDALAVGFSFAFLDLAIVKPVIIIGAVTFCLSLIGVYLGDMLGHIFENKIEVAGGIFIIGIGIRILVEHLFF